MAGQSNAAAAVIKRKKVVQASSHHGGAWKVAYADFVTAMMTFFLLMWLLNATTEKQRKGLADYFNPTIAISRISGGGEGAFGGTSVLTEERLARNGTGASDRRATESNRARGETGLDPSAPASEALKEMQREVDSALAARGGESATMERLLRHVVTRVSDEGVVIEVFDLDDSPLFERDSDVPTSTARELAAVLAGIVLPAPNPVSVDGHVRAYPITLIDTPVWRLSVGRAQAMRGLLQSRGLSAARLARVTGHADRVAVTANPMAARNNRVEIILLRLDR